jgi:hypothetical protein
MCFAVGSLRRDDSSGQNSNLLLAIANTIQEPVDELYVVLTQRASLNSRQAVPGYQKTKISGNHCCPTRKRTFEQSAHGHVRACGTVACLLAETRQYP